MDLVHLSIPETPSAHKTKVQYANREAPTKLVVVGEQKQGMSFALPGLDKTKWEIYTLGENNS